MFENEDERKVSTRYYLSKVEIKDYNVTIDGKNLFDQPVKHNMRENDNIREITTNQGDDYTLVVYWTVIISKIIIKWYQWI